MIALSNRDVFLIGQIADDGIYALVIWLKDKAIAGTEQTLWNRFENTVHGLVRIPPETAQVHTEIFIPYVEANSLGSPANHA